MTQSDYITLNEKLEERLSKESFYINHLYYFLKKALQIDNQCALFQDETGKKVPPPYYKNIGKEIDLNLGFSMIQKYLRQVSPTLEQEFIEKLKNGVIQLNYNDKRSREDSFLEEIDNQNICRVQTVFPKGKYSPFTLVDVSNKKTNYYLFATLIHEFFHSVCIDAKRCDKDFLNEFYSIYFEFDFLKFLEREQVEASQIFPSFFLRYQDTLYIIDGEFIDVTAFLYKKQKESVIDEESYHLGDLVINESEYPSCGQKVLTFLKKNENEEKAAEYLFGTVFAYFLSQKEDMELTRKILAVSQSKEPLSVLQKLSKIGVSFQEFVQLDFGKVMESLKKEYLRLQSKTKDSPTDNFQFTKNKKW